jgi:hypothetical protein
MKNFCETESIDFTKKEALSGAELILSTSSLAQKFLERFDSKQEPLCPSREEWIRKALGMILI